MALPYIHLPNRDFSTSLWGLVGTGVTALYQALNNDDDTKYITSPSGKATATVAFPVDISSANVPVGAVITSVTVKLRCSVNGSPPAGTAASLTVNVQADDNTARFTARTIYVTSAVPTDFAVASYHVDPLGLAWDVHRLNHLLCRVFSYVGIAGLLRCYKFWTEVNYRVRPTVTVDAPSGTVTTPSPVISWTYAQDDGDPQDRVEYKLFTAVQQAQVSFNPDTDAPVFSASLDGEVSSVTLPTSINPDSYWVYVRVFSSYGAKSTWVGKQFVVDGPSPGAPGLPDPDVPGNGFIEVVTDRSEGQATLTLRDRSNLLSAHTASVESTTDTGVFTATNCVIDKDTTTAFPGGSASVKLTSSASGDMTAMTDWNEIDPTTPLTGRVQFKTAVSARSCRVRVLFYDGSFASVGGTLTGDSITDATGTWIEATVTGTPPATAVYARLAADVLATGAASEVHNIDLIGLMYGSDTPYSDGGHSSRNLLSSWYSTCDGAPQAGEAWTAGGGTTVATAAPPGVGGSGALCNKMTYSGLSPSIALRAAGTVFTSPTSGIDYTLNKPAGVADGDLMLAFVTASELTTINPPAGWTFVDQARVDDGLTNGDTSLFVLKRTAGASEPASWTTGTVGLASLRRTAVVVAYSGAAIASEQFLATGTAATGVGTPLYLTTPTLNNTDPNAWRISAFALGDNASGGTLTANKQVPSTVPAIQFVGKGTAWGVQGTGGGTTFTIYKPAGVVQGDLMIASLATSVELSSFTPPSGWTLVRRTLRDFTHIVMYRYAGASEPSSWSGNVALSSNIRMCMAVAYRNVHATVPFIDEDVKTSTGGNTMTTTAVTNNNSGAWRVSIFTSEADNTQLRWITNEVSVRDQGGLYYYSGGYQAMEQLVADSNASVSTGEHTRVGSWTGGSWDDAIGWVGLLNPLSAPPSGIPDETVRATMTTGSSDPWITARVFDSNGVIPTGNASVTGLWAPGSGTEFNSIAGWHGIIKPAAPVVAGFASAEMADTVDISSIADEVLEYANHKVAVTAAFIGSVGSTPYLTCHFYRANQLLSEVTAEGTPFGTSLWVKSFATFDMPEGTTRMKLGVSASNLSINDIAYWDRVSLALGDDSEFRAGTAQSSHPVWSRPDIQYADDAGNGFSEWATLPGSVTNKPSYEALTGMVRYADHTVIPLTNRKYRARTISHGLAGDLFVSSWGPQSSEFRLIAEKWWLKDIANPHNNVQLKVKWEAVPVTRTNTATAFQPLGRDLPVVLSEGYKGHSFTLKLIPVNQYDMSQLEVLLESERTLFLQSDVDRAWWVRAVGDLKWDILPTAERQEFPLREVTVSFVQVDAVL